MYIEVFLFGGVDLISIFVGNKTNEMLDINGVEITVGVRVITTQPNGGILSPASSEIGIVEETTDSFGNKTLQIRYRKEDQDFDRFILLDGKMNEVVK